MGHRAFNFEFWILDFGFKSPILSLTPSHPLHPHTPKPLHPHTPKPLHPHTPYTLTPLTPSHPLHPHTLTPLNPYTPLEDRN